MRKPVLILGVVVATAALPVLADYFGLFGTHRIETREFLSVRFRPVDARTGKPIAGVHVKCAVAGAHERRPCTQRGDGSDGSVVAQFVLARQRERTLLFDKGEVPLGAMSGQVTAVFIHPDYERVFLPIDLDALPGMEERDNPVKLTPAAASGTAGGEADE